MSEKKWLKKGFDHINDITQWPDWKKAQLSEPPLNDHTLNACLARVIGVEIFKIKNRFGITQWDTRENGVWDPLHDANQMEEVEAWLRTHGWDFECVWKNRHQLYFVRLKREELLKHSAHDRSKKRAFALAIGQMEQSNNNKRG